MLLSMTRQEPVQIDSLDFTESNQEFRMWTLTLEIPRDILLVNPKAFGIAVL